MKPRTNISRFIRWNFLTAGLLAFISTLSILFIAEASDHQQNGNLDNQVFLPMIGSAPPRNAAEGAAITGSLFYVSRNGNNSNGRSWATAWNELDQIEWNQVRPGDGIIIDGGSQSMTYRTTLRPAASGSNDKPIVIRLASDNGRTGQAIFFGGNGVPLPECGQKTWDTSQHQNAGVAGIELDNGISNIVIDGRKRGGIVIHGWKQHGVKFKPDTSSNNRDDNPKNITLLYMEIYNNGGIRQQNDGASQNLYYPDHGGSGIKLAGIGHSFHFLEVHDNAGDAIQSAYTNPGGGVHNNMDDFTLTDSWLYNQRKHSGVDNSPSGETCTASNRSGCDELGAPQMGKHYYEYPSTPANRQESFNWCTHSDGIQIYSSGEFDTMHIERTIIGPNFMNALLLGDRNSTNHTAWVNNLTLKDVVLTRYMFAAAGMKNRPDRAGKNWDLNNVTIYGHHSNTNKGTLNLDSNANHDEHRIVNSIMMYGRTNFPNGNIAFNNNCEFAMYSDTIGGRKVDPQFKTILNRDVFEDNLSVDFATVFIDDYTPQNGVCRSAGSGISSVAELLAGFNRE